MWKSLAPPVAQIVMQPVTIKSTRIKIPFVMRPVLSKT
ncbi:Uncharacterised protein [Vibrio cholerae]|nr:Uncharacterised protein [Vibrio cholerae]